MTDEMYARIREVADEHDGRLDVTVSHPDLLTPVIALPRRSSRDRPEVYMTESDVDDFRARIKTEGLRPTGPAAPLGGQFADDFEIFATGTPFPDAVRGTVSLGTADYSRYLDCVYTGRHTEGWNGCPCCGFTHRDFDAKAVWR